MPQDNSKELRDLLGPKFDDFFPDGLEGSVQKQTFQSEIFQRAGYDTSPEKYGAGDGFLYTVKRADNRTIFVIKGKILTGNPFEVGHAASGCLDLREFMTVVYEYDGEKITETNAETGEQYTYIGEQADPELLMLFINETLGKKVRG